MRGDHPRHGGTGHHFHGRGSGGRADGVTLGEGEPPGERHVGRKLAAQQELRPPIVLPSPQRHCDPNAEPCTSTLAQIESFKAYGVKNYALAVPYLESVTKAIIATYEGAGFHCASSAHLGICTNAEFAYVPDEMTRKLVRESDSPDAEAISIICTNFPAGWLVEELETAQGKPVFDSTVITVWQTLRMVGFNEPLAGWGRLLREPAGMFSQP